MHVVVYGFAGFQFVSSGWSGYMGSGCFLRMCDAVGWKVISMANPSPNKLRITTVCHPCDCILRHFYRTPTLNTSCEDYIRKYPGNAWVGWSHRQVQADTVLRMEDMPWAFIEFAESLGIPDKVLNTLRDEKPAPVPAYDWDPGLRRQVMEAEREFCERYNYF